MLAAFHEVDERIQREASFTVTPHLVHNLFVVQSVASTNIGKVRSVCVCECVSESVCVCVCVCVRVCHVCVCSSLHPSSRALGNKAIACASEIER